MEWFNRILKKLKQPQEAAELPPLVAIDIDTSQPAPVFRTDYVLRLPDRSFYRGPGLALGTIERTKFVEEAQGFRTRWDAASEAASNSIFAGSWILVRSEIKDEHTRHDG